MFNAKHRYFIANDLRDWEALRDVFTEEAPEGFSCVLDDWRRQKDNR